MRSETQKISITFEKKDSISIINALRKGLGNNEHIDPTPKTEGARKLLKLLDHNFVTSHTGINTV